ncbi:hypothetical protein Tco_1093988 [Tanacetum coccineum]|uniref:Xylulose kinase-1 n=1 Tax=Tanacetum coccineum TaxID=301880 RepID=A0ABQ5IET6_9ASTR
MVALKFASSHNMVVFLDKPTESDGFEQIVDFLNAHSIKYALTVNPTIYTSCIEQFWTTTKVKTVNEEVQIQALVDKKKVIVNETSVRSDLQLKDAEEPIAYKTENVESLPTHSNDPLLSGEDRLKLNELMELCTSISQRVIALETTKTNQALEIDSLKRRVKKIEKKKGLRTHKLRRLFKGRKITDLDADADVTFVNEAQGRNNDNLMFDTGVLDKQEVEVEKVVSTTEVTTASATTTIDELTLAQTLIEIKAAKPKAITTAATTTTTAFTRPKARGVIVQEPSEIKTTTSSSQTSQLPQAKDKDKEKMVDPKKPLKKKDQILIDEEIDQRLQEELQAELEEEERLARQKEEDASITKWDNVQAMIDVDYELGVRLQAQEQEELTIKERSKMFVELMDKRKKHFARLRAKD